MGTIAVVIDACIEERIGCGSGRVAVVEQAPDERPEHRTAAQVKRVVEEAAHRRSESATEVHEPVSGFFGVVVKSIKEERAERFGGTGFLVSFEPDQPAIEGRMSRHPVWDGGVADKSLSLCTPNVGASEGRSGNCGLQGIVDRLIGHDLIRLILSPLWVVGFGLG
jgi:hypothetical protein